METLDNSKENEKFIGIYSLSKEFITQRNILEFSLEERISLEKLLSNYKGYVYVGNDSTYLPHTDGVFEQGAFITYHTHQFLSIAQDLQIFNTWVTKNYKALQAKFKDADALQDTILYVIEKLHTPRGVNDFGKLIAYKYKKILLSNKTSKENKEISFDSFFSLDCVDISSELTNETHNHLTQEPTDDLCLIEVNAILKHNLLTNYLRESYPQWQVEVFLGWIDVKDKRGSSYVTNKSKELKVGRNTLYKIIKDILQRMKENSKEIETLFGILKYNSLDESSLRNFM